MSDTETEARAIVVVTLEIPIPGGGWGDNCTVGQVYKQARDTLDGLLRTTFFGNPGTGTKPTLPRETRIIGKPIVKQILAQRKR